VALTAMPSRGRRAILARLPEAPSGPGEVATVAANGRREVRVQVERISLELIGRPAGGDLPDRALWPPLSRRSMSDAPPLPWAGRLVGQWLRLVEAVDAAALERRASKDRILAAYLNQVYFGEGVYGTATAAEHYFATPVARLSLAQAAALAGTIASPMRFRPTAGRAALAQPAATWSWTAPGSRCGVRPAPGCAGRSRRRRRGHLSVHQLLRQPAHSLAQHIGVLVSQHLADQFAHAHPAHVGHPQDPATPQDATLLRPPRAAWSQLGLGSGPNDTRRGV